MSTGNLRRHTRTALRAKARLVYTQGEIEGTIENIGEGGLFFVTDTLEGALAVGDEITAIYDESGEEKQRSGEILRIERYFHDGELFRAFAVRFRSSG
jgi:PilZ domain